MLRAAAEARRGALVALVAALLAAGCATSRLADTESIVDLATGRRIDRAELIGRMRSSDLLLLGELHDNPAHHARRGELIEALRPPVVVTEQLPAGARVRFGPDLLASLTEAGFEAKPWGWPLHEPVFAAAAAAGSALLGGNLPRAQARSIATTGEAAWPEDLRRLLEASPLAEAGRAALDADLQRGHCGQLSAARLPAIRAAQRARDASMTRTLLDAPQRPALLVAGNGHVRLDYGVGQLLGQLRPAERVLSIGFIELGNELPAPTQYSVAWVTAKADRADPCAGFSAPSMR